MSDKKIGFQLTFPENLKKDVHLSSTPKLAFDDLGEFIEERQRIKRLLETANEASLKVDYSDYANHVFFDSAVSKFQIAQSRILTKFPYNGNGEEKDAYFLTSSDYENYIFEQWPRHVGYVQFSASSAVYFSASDLDKKLVFATSSLMLSADVRVEVDAASVSRNIVAIQSGTSATNTAAHLKMFLSGGGAGPLSIVFQIASGSTIQERVVNYDSYAYSGSWHNVAVSLDRNTNLLNAYIDGNRVSSASVSIGPIEQNTIYVFGGGGTGYSTLSGAIDNVRLYLTASERLLQKHVNKPIDAEDYLVLNYTFNEGVVGTASVDLNVVDYSKSALHAVIDGYSSSVRASGTSRFNDPGDPILYSFHSSVIAFSGTNVLSASMYDKENNNQIFNMMPEYLLRVDSQQEGLMTAFSLALARFFDELKLYIDQFDNLRITNYDDENESPDVFLPFLTRYFGWKATEHFGDTNPLSFFFGEGVLSTGSLDVPLVEIRNQFWRRTLNNLPYLLKTKGKRNNLDAFFNVLGLNRENINLKEYGYLPGGSMADTRIHKEKVVSLLGMTGSLSSSYVKVPAFISASDSSYTVEAFLQLPYVSASYSASLSVLTGSVWQFVDNQQVTGSFALLWNIPTLGSTQGKFILTGSDGQYFSSSLVEVFDGDFVYVAAGLRENQLPFIEIRTLDNDSLDFTGSYSGSVAMSGIFTGSKFDFVMGATSGTFFQKQTQGYFGEYRYWNRPLSSSEINDHAYNFQSVGVYDPAEAPHPLRGHWPLAENKQSDGSGIIHTILDLSRNNFIATGSLFNPSHNPYKKFLVEYNYLSPSIDLRWTENKVRIRNKTELTIKDIATDTNEVSLEFNLVDSLNQDITKIFSTLDLFNNAIGSPVNKYRDEYADLEAYRRVYFDRLGDSIHFNQFFGLFKWFDKKISDAIKQLLPTRVKFIGGEQVVESHTLERPRYQYKYPIFRTPADIPNAELSGFVAVDGKSLEILPLGEALGTYPGTLLEAKKKYSSISMTNNLTALDAQTPAKMVSDFNHSADNPDRISGPTGFYRIKISGDTRDTLNNPNSGINSRNEHVRSALQRLERDNKDGYRSGSFINSDCGNAFVMQDVDSSKDQEYYFGDAKKVINLYLGVSSGTNSDLLNPETGSVAYDRVNNITYVTGSIVGPIAIGYGAIFTASLYDANDCPITSSQQYPNIFDHYNFALQDVERYPYEVSFELSRSRLGSDIASMGLSLNNQTILSAQITPTGSHTDNFSPYFSFTVKELENNWQRYIINPENSNFSSMPRVFALTATSGTEKMIFNFTIADLAAPPAATAYVFAIRNLRYRFTEGLTQDGVKHYRDLNNDHNRKIVTYMKYDTLKKVE